MENTVDRRTFLKTAAAASAAVTVLKPGTVFGSAANSTVRLGIIGCGGRGTGVISSMVRNTDSRIVAIADLFEDQLTKGRENLNRVNREKGHPQIEDSHLFLGSKAYLRLLDLKDVDAVLVSTPAFLHPVHLEAAVDAGKHAYCEKPVAIDPAGVKRIQRIGKKAAGKTTLVVGFQIRHATPYVEMVKRIQQGDIGDIVTVQAYYLAGSIPIKWRDDVPQDEARLRAWFWDLALSGDILVEQGIHVVDIMNWVFKSPPLKSFGAGGRAGRNDRGNVWSHYNVIFEYPGKVHASFQSTQFDPGYGDVCVRFFGTRGVAEAHYTGGVFIKGEKPWDSGVVRGTAETVTKEQWAAGAFKSSLDDADPNKQKAFIESIKSGNLINEADAGAESALTAMMGRTAAYTGREATWDQMIRSNERFDPRLDLTKFDKKG
ncbi:MAG: Gfo/Idh/MocA family oxidoreductase [Candidatus Latescibacter sp.]|nr:Gfo/Idh/MocA family oxidoreductase [Candidatus Latescibacter sp.]